MFLVVAALAAMASCATMKKQPSKTTKPVTAPRTLDPKDLANVTGGMPSPRDPQSGLPTG